MRIMNNIIAFIARRVILRCMRIAAVSHVGLIPVVVFSSPIVLAQGTLQFTEQEVASIVAHGPWPMTFPPDSGNEMSGALWAEQLGGSLFQDASLSVNRTISCATCHLPDNGFDDDLPVGIGLEVGVRNTQSLLNVGLQRWFGWDGGADSLWAASIRPMLNPSEMGNDLASLAKSLRANALFMSTIESKQAELSWNKHTQKDASKINANTDGGLTDEQLIAVAGKAIAAYLRTLRSAETPFDRFRKALVTNDAEGQAAYSASAKRGLKIFIGDANCRVCHFGGNFSNGEFHDTGRPFFTGVGKVDPGRYTGIQRVKNDIYNLLGQYSAPSETVDKLKTSEVKLGQSNWGQWRTPSLRNLTQTAPYMHDGSLTTLRDVVDAYADIDSDRLHSQGESILKPLNLTNVQRDDLVNFLLSLSE